MVSIEKSKKILGTEWRKHSDKDIKKEDISLWKGLFELVQIFSEIDLSDEE